MIAGDGVFLSVYLSGVYGTLRHFVLPGLGCSARHTTKFGSAFSSDGAPAKAR